MSHLNPKYKLFSFLAKISVKRRARSWGSETKSPTDGGEEEDGGWREEEETDVPGHRAKDDGCVVAGRLRLIKLRRHVLRSCERLLQRIHKKGSDVSGESEWSERTMGLKTTTGDKSSGRRKIKAKNSRPLRFVCETRVVLDHFCDAMMMSSLTRIKKKKSTGALPGWDQETAANTSPERQEVCFWVGCVRRHVRGLQSNVSRSVL